MSRKVLMFVLRRSESALRAGRELSSWLKSRGLEPLDVSDVEGPFPSATLAGVELGVAIGGDGTFLRLVRQLEENKDKFPLLGVNLGTLGFITDTDPMEMIPTVQDALERKGIEQKRMLLDVSLWRGGKRIETATVFNDAVLAKEARSTLIKFEVRMGEELLSEVGADGFIVSTPTGSTAYCLSAGGPIVHPDLRCLVLVPLCSHALSARPVLVPDSRSVEIRLDPDTEKGVLICDGQVSFEVVGGDRILAQTSSKSLRIVASPKRKWSEALRSKLNMA